MAVIIVAESEGYTERILKPILPTFERCGIRAIFNHCYLTSENETEVPNRELLGMDYAPIQPNSAYFICKFEKTTTEPKVSRYIRRLQTPIDKSGSIFVELGKFSHYREWDLPWTAKISKDITFYDKVTQESIGWYNKDSNILCMADLGNYPETALGNLDVVIHHILRYKNTGKFPFVKITIGSDPEFEIVARDGNIVSADSLFHDPNKNKLIGTDGHNETGELRPQFATNPLKLARNIKRLVRKLHNNPNLGSGVEVYAGGGTKVMTGGHIHFGIQSMPEDLKDIMWKLVAVPVLRHQGKLRTGDTSKCKKNGNDIVRQQPHGIEWRVLPSFIVNEDITVATLCTAYAIVKSYFSGGTPTTIGKNAYYKLSLYPQYKEYIDRFVELFVKDEELEQPSLLENRSLLREWKIARLNKKPSVIINCYDPNLAKFFTPLYVKLEDTVKVQIQFGPDHYIATHNVPPVLRDKFKKFARKHFVECMESAAPPDTRHFKGNDFAIYLPVFWSPKDMDIAKDMFEELKDLVRESIIEFDRNRSR